MFKSKSKPQRIDTLIGAGTRIIGDVHFSGGFHVDGHIKGNVDALAGFGRHFECQRRRHCGRLGCGTECDPEWHCKGDILAHDRVELGATARVTGNVYYGLIEMEMGAEINGKLIHEPRKGSPVAQADRNRKRRQRTTKRELRVFDALAARS